MSLFCQNGLLLSSYSHNGVSNGNLCGVLKWTVLIGCMPFLSPNNEAHNWQWKFSFKKMSQHTHTTILRPFFRDHPGEPVPEQNFWTLWCKGRLTEADILTIRLGTTPSGLTSAHLHHPPIFFTGRMPFLPPNQQCQSTEGNCAHTYIASVSFYQRIWHYISFYFFLYEQFLKMSVGFEFRFSFCAFVEV